MNIDRNAPDVYTTLELYYPKEEGIYLVITKSRWTTMPIPIVARFVFTRYANDGQTLDPFDPPEGVFITPHGNTQISCTHWTTIKTKLPI